VDTGGGLFDRLFGWIDDLVGTLEAGSGTAE
jgi:hypothetical protein